MNIPASFTAGDSLAYTDSLSDYPASSGWVLSYVLVKDGTQINISSSADGDDHSVSVLASATVLYDSGTYHWQAFVTKTTERYTVGTGIVAINPDFATQSTGLDDRSHAKKVLDALEAVIEGKAGKDITSYSIGGRSVTKMTPEEILMWRDKYRAEYRKEQVAAGNVTSNTIKVRFV